MDQVSGSAAAPETVKPLGGSLDAAIQAEIEHVEQLDGPEDGPADGADNPTEDNPDDRDAADTEADEAPSDEDEAQSSAAPSVEIEHDGKKYTIPAELKDSFLRHDDYTRKTMELGQSRSQLESFAQQLARSFQANEVYSAQLSECRLVDSQIAERVNFLQSNPMLQQSQPDEYMRLTGELSLLQYRREQAANGLQAAISERDRFEEQRNSMSRQEGAKYLREKGFTARDLQNATGYAKTQGLPDMVLAWLSNGNAPQALLMIEKARKYDELQAKKPAVQKKVAKAPAPVRPGAVAPSQGQGPEALRRTLRGTGGVKDAVALEIALAGGGRRR